MHQTPAELAVASLAVSTVLYLSLPVWPVGERFMEKKRVKPAT